MPCRNENKFKQDNQRFENRYKEVEGDILCNIYEELQNFYFIQSDEGDDNPEFVIIIPNLLDLDLEDSNSVSDAPCSDISSEFKRLVYWFGHPNSGSQKTFQPFLFILERVKLYSLITFQINSTFARALQ